MEELTERHLKIPEAIAKRYHKFFKGRFELEEVIAEGNLYLIKAYNNYKPQVHEKSNLGAFLYHSVDLAIKAYIGLTGSIDKNGKRRKRKEAQYKDKVTLQDFSEFDATQSREDRIKSEDLENADRVLAKLSPVEKVLFVYSNQHGIGARTISEKTGISVSVLRVKREKAVKRVKNKIKHDLGNLKNKRSKDIQNRYIANLSPEQRQEHQKKAGEAAGASQKEKAVARRITGDMPVNDKYSYFVDHTNTTVYGPVVRMADICEVVLDETTKKVLDVVVQRLRPSVIAKLLPENTEIIKNPKKLLQEKNYKIRYMEEYLRPADHRSLTKIRSNYIEAVGMTDKDKYYQAAYKMADEEQKPVMIIWEPEKHDWGKNTMPYYIFLENADEYEKKHGEVIPPRKVFK